MEEEDPVFKFCPFNLQLTSKKLDICINMCCKYDCQEGCILKFASFGIYISKN